MCYNSDPSLLCEPKTDYVDTKGPMHRWSVNYAWISAGFPRQLVLILVALYDVHDGAQLIKLDGQRPVFR